jgi:hypothetical protein
MAMYWEVAQKRGGGKLNRYDHKVKKTCFLGFLEPGCPFRIVGHRPDLESPNF